jgi:roadblock/LC7 domain-containing protein
VERGQASEDRVTGAIERQTSMVPSSLFLGLALGSMAVSAFLKISGKNHWTLFVGQWAAPAWVAYVIFGALWVFVMWSKTHR